MFKPVKYHIGLLAVSIFAGIYASVSNNPASFSFDGSEASIGRFAQCGFAIVGAYLVLRFFWPKR